MKSKVNLPFSLVLLFFTWTFSSCFYDNEENLYPSRSGPLKNISYAEDIVPLIDNSCNKSCHASSIRQGNINLEGYDQIRPFAAGGSLLGAIKQLNGFSPMPKAGSKLAATQIQLVETWINEGIKNN
jgi:hypothetical protein